MNIKNITKKGTIFVKIEKDKQKTTILYSNTGPGITADLRDKVFEPFFTTREKGTGLGLAVVKNLVEQNSGKINYIIDNENGAHFLIEF